MWKEGEGEGALKEGIGVWNVGVEEVEGGRRRWKGKGQQRTNRTGRQTLNWNSDHDKVELDLNGESEFGKGILGEISPIKTMVEVSYDCEAQDLVGKVTKVMADKTFSITFPVGSGFEMSNIMVGA